MIECGICHGSCVTKTKKAQYDTIRVYRCRHTEQFVNGTGSCSNKTYIDERILCACMQFVIRKLSINAEEIRKQLLDVLNSSGEKDRLPDNIRAFEKQVEKQNVKKKKMLSLLLDGVLSKDDYQSAEHIARILEQVRKYTVQEVVTKQLYSEVLEKIVIYSDTHVDVYLQGMAVPFAVAYRRTGRGTQYTVFCEDYSDMC